MSAPAPAHKYASVLAGAWALDVPYAQENWGAEECSLRLIDGPTHNIVMAARSQER